MRDKQIKKLIHALSNWSIPFIITGFIILIISLIIGTLEFSNYHNVNIGNVLLNMGLPIFALGVAFLSVKLAGETDEKMESITTSDFYEITYRFWDRAPVLYKEQPLEVRDTYSWQLENLF